MKLQKLYWVICSAVIFLLFSFQEPKLKKRITDTSFKYEFYVTDKEPEVESDRIYYWFKGGAIHNSEYGVSGNLLDDTFDKFYLNNQLAEQGSFNKGLKVGLWKTWYENGAVETTQYWDEGRKKGFFYHYTQDGQLMEKGRYRADKKQGKWINYISKDTISYKKGEIVAAKVKGKKLNDFFKRLVTKIDRSKDPVKETKAKSTKKSKTPSVKTNSKQKKKGFFQRLFSKKEKPNGKSA